VVFQRIVSAYIRLNWNRRSYAYTEADYPVFPITPRLALDLDAIVLESNTKRSCSFYVILLLEQEVVLFPTGPY